MKKILLISLMVLFIFPNVFSEEKTKEENLPEPYTKDEFSPALRDLRRAEIIFFGAFPISFFFSSIGYDISKGILKENYRFDDQEEKKAIILSSVILSSVVVALDYFLGKTQTKSE